MSADRPAERWDGVPVATLRRRWRVPELRVYPSVDSTNDVARDLAGDGARAGTVVLADQQRRGRGRRGRQWTPASGESLLLSMVLRPGADAAGDTVLSIRLGLAAARAIEDETGAVVGIKWPNDLLVDGRKVAGVLCESALAGGRTLYVVAGIGVNLTQPDDAWPPALAGTATSLAARTGEAPRRVALAGRVVRAWLGAARPDAPALSDDELADFARRDVLAGRPVAVEGLPAGTAAGVAPDGGLRLHGERGTRSLVAGSVRALESP
jgi:BirA family biotin operon repressor/biotin-[acetyl-CoA-carboxylase] ligase